MMPDAAVTSFAIVFTVFVVVTAVLLVLVIRFTIQRASAARARWLADRRRRSAEPAIDEDDDDRELTALVLGGGGTRGAVQIGMLQVLTEHGFVPDRIYGSSVGAVNGVAFAGDPTRSGVERMTEIWTRAHPRRRLPPGPSARALALLSAARLGVPQLAGCARSSRTASTSNGWRTR